MTALIGHRVKALAILSTAFVLAACSSTPHVEPPTDSQLPGDSGMTPVMRHVDAALPDAAPIDAAPRPICFPCEYYWICGGDVSRIDLKPEVDGCYLSGLPGRNLLAPDGTITRDGVVVGKATGTGARVSVTAPDGSQWLYCAAGGGCHN